MGKSKSKKQQARVDKPGPDDFTYLAVFFPVGRNGAAMTKDSDPADQAAAIRIGTWMHHAGLPIRKLFSRKTEEHVLVEVREEVPQDVIDSKLGAYKWGDMLHSILPKDVAAESTIMRARVRSHDAVEKMGGMVYFSIPRIVPDGPRGESRFKDPFPQPRKRSLTEPSTFSAIKYLPLPPHLELAPQEDVKPRIVDEETKPDVKPNVKPEPNQDVKPSSVKEESKPSVPNGDTSGDGPDTKPLSVKAEGGRQSSSLSAGPSNVETKPDTKPKITTKTEAEAGPDGPDMEIPVWDMMVDEAKPKVETKTEAENTTVSESNANNASRNAADLNPLATQPTNPNRVAADGPDSSDKIPVWDMMVDETKPKVETKTETENAVVSESNANNASRNTTEPNPLAAQPTNPNRVAKDGPDSSDMEIPVWDMMIDETKPKVEIKAEAKNIVVSEVNSNNASENVVKPSPLAPQPTDLKGEAEDGPDSPEIEVPVWDMMVDEAKPKVEMKTEAENAYSKAGAVSDINPNSTSGNATELSLAAAQPKNPSRGAAQDKRILPIKAEAGEGHVDSLPGAQGRSTSQPAGSKRPAEEEVECKAAVKRERRED